MISLGIAILPTSCSSAPNSRLRRCSASRSSASATASGERDDALAVLAGVAVVGLDDVAEHERGPAVGAVELEQALERGAGARARTGASSPSSGSSASTAAGLAGSPRRPRGRRPTAPRRLPYTHVSRSCAQVGPGSIAEAQGRRRRSRRRTARAARRPAARRRRASARRRRARRRRPGRPRTTSCSRRQQAARPHPPGQDSGSRAISERDAATASGTRPSGSANSSGTKASWVAPVNPSGVSKRPASRGPAPAGSSSRTELERGRRKRPP